MFQLLVTFLSVYETHNFTRSADNLYLSQPTVSAQIKKLEDYLNVSLFIRNGKQEIVPTKEADFLYPRVLKIIEEWDNVIHHISTQKIFREKCVFASSQTCGAFFIPRIVPILIKHFPMIDFSFPTMSGEKIIHGIEQAKIDFGIIETPERSDQVDRYLLGRDELVLAGSPLADVWLLPESNSPLAEINESYLKIHNLSIRMIRTNNHEMTLSLLKNGVGKTIISKMPLINTEIPWIPLQIDTDRNFYFLTRQKVVSEKLTEVAEFIKEEIQKLNEPPFK